MGHTQKKNPTLLFRDIMHEVPQKGDKIQYFEMYTVHLVISDLEKYCMYGSLNVLKKIKNRHFTTQTEQYTKPKAHRGKLSLQLQSFYRVCGKC